MIELIIQILLLSAILVMAFFCQRQNVQATEKLKQVREREKRLKELAKPPVSYCWAIDFDRSCVIVGAKYWGRGWQCDVNFKEFRLTPRTARTRNLPFVRPRS